MNLADFPMDIQRCPLKFGSCKYENLRAHQKNNRQKQNKIEQSGGGKRNTFDRMR